MSQQILEKAQSKAKSSIQIEEIQVDDYENVLRITDASCGLHAIIAIHDTTLGPALGGTRIYPYPNEQAALQDVLRLAKGMTYKSSVAGPGLGGGKSVIIADPKTQKTPELLRAFGRAVEKLQGLYICAEDVGCSTLDVAMIREGTKYVVGLPHEKSSGDPSFYTAWGVFRGIQSVIKKLFGSDSLKGKKVAIQGLGNVGSHLADYLFWSGAELILTDIDQERVQAMAKRYGAQVVDPDEIFGVPCDVFAPCAMGGIINERTIPLLNCRAIAGGANNQLLREEDADLLDQRQILWAPDFIINAGGLLNVAQEIEVEGYSPTASRDKVNEIYNTLLSVYQIAEENGQSTQDAAIVLAKTRIQEKRGKRQTAPVFHHSL